MSKYYKNKKEKQNKSWGDQTKTHGEETKRKPITNNVWFCKQNVLTAIVRKVNIEKENVEKTITNFQYDLYAFPNKRKTLMH